MASQGADPGAVVMHEVEIEVNNQPVVVPMDTTGGGIKTAAAVPADYQLFEIRGSQEIQVEDGQSIKVHKGERFVATPPIEPA